MILSKLSPAETLILLNSAKVELKELLKFTLMDLLLKQVLIIQEVERQPHWRYGIRVYKYISTGKNFHGYTSAHHELVFLSGFNANAGRRILFRNLVRVAYENAGTEKSFRKTLLGSQELQDAFKKSLWQKLLGGFDYTPYGNELKIKVENEVRELEEKIPDYLLNDKTRALECLRLIGGNVFLLRGIEFALLKEIETEILKELTEQESKRNTTSGCNSTGGCWTTFDDHGGDFDNSCSANTGSGWGSGCWGDSGCSGGDSGCGGGCGGD